MDQILAVLDPGWIGVLLGVLGVGFGIYQIVRRTGARLAYQYMGQLLIGGGGGLLPNEIVVEFDGQQIPRVSRCQIVIWNKGQSPIKGEDVVSEHPIQISFGENATILKAEIVQSTRTANNTIITVESTIRNSAILSFNFIDRNDGALIRIFHTGTRQKPKIDGTIIGIPKGIQGLGRIPIIFPSRMIFIPRRMRPIISRTWRIFVAIPPLIGITAIIAAIFPSIYYSIPGMPEKLTKAPLIIIGVVYLFPLLAIWSLRRRFPSSLMPEEFDYSSYDKLDAGEQI